MLKTIPAKALRLGMYIHAPDGSWLDYPDWRTQYLLNDPDELARLQRSGIRAFIIDIVRGDDVEPEQVPVARARPQPVPRAAPEPAPRPSVARCSAEEEFGNAELTVARATKTVTEMLDQARLGKAVDVARTAPVIEDISRSIDRNPSALISYARIKSSDQYTYMHSVAVCALMISLGRQLLFDDDVVAELGLAGLMLDIGKAALPVELIKKPGQLTPEERALMRQHPLRGHDLLSRSKVSDIVLEVCLHHHERADGSGYPHRLSGEKIGLHARMAAICDVYDAMTSQRPYKASEQPADVLSQMFRSVGQFDSAALAAFIRSVGIYPVGSLVRLRSNRLAVVVEQNEADLTQPRLRAFYSIAQRAALQPVSIDLAAEGDEILSREQPERWGFRSWDATWSQILRRETMRSAA